ncbi:psbP domain-containing protein 7, chloroplastic [Andrographis paniculata]|uniref:psbP domain-containing protein 7, chloroplastic n=1 Tax=Andrographis paniculata TaxID=175694 RepID=UPI0021E8EE81|nr:psbP domain-containing protein 7, chloroplastic [Andrographis paniculata]
MLQFQSITTSQPTNLTKSKIHQPKMMCPCPQQLFTNSNSHRIYCTTQSSHDGGNNHFRTPADQFRRLQSVFRRRLLTGIAAASALAIGANFGGVTSFVLGFSPEAARSLKLDAVYPVAGYSRYIDANQGFEFVYPETWLGDQTLLYRAAGRAERSLDPPPLSDGGRRRKAVNEPAVAFGPPGSTGELNVSVIVSPVPIDFSIEAFGGAEEVGANVVRTIAGKRTDVMGRLIGSSMRVDAKARYYEIEFGVEGRDFLRHNVAVCCARQGRLFTLNVQAPESAWPQYQTQLYTIAHSFTLL